MIGQASLGEARTSKFEQFEQFDHATLLEVELILATGPIACRLLQTLETVPVVLIYLACTGVDRR